MTDQRARARLVGGGERRANIIGVARCDAQSGHVDEQRFDRRDRFAWRRCGQRRDRFGDALCDGRGTHTATGAGFAHSRHSDQDASTRASVRSPSATRSLTKIPWSPSDSKRLRR